MRHDDVEESCGGGSLWLGTGFTLLKQHALIKKENYATLKASLFVKKKKEKKKTNIRSSVKSNDTVTEGLNIAHTIIGTAEYK